MNTCLKFGENSKVEGHLWFQSHRLQFHLRPAEKWNDGIFFFDQRKESKVTRVTVSDTWRLTRLMKWRVDAAWTPCTHLLLLCSLLLAFQTLSPVTGQNRPPLSAPSLWSPQCPLLSPTMSLLSLEALRDKDCSNCWTVWLFVFSAFCWWPKYEVDILTTNTLTSTTLFTSEILIIRIKKKEIHYHKTLKIWSPSGCSPAVLMVTSGGWVSDHYLQNKW